MAKKQNIVNSEKLAEIIVQGIQEKKGHQIKIMDLRKVQNSISDFFIVCHGASNRQVGSIADAVVEQVQKISGERPFNLEGKSLADWILLDYVNVVVHVFQEEIRTHYALEDLWADAIITEIKE